MILLVSFQPGPMDTLLLGCCMVPLCVREKCPPLQAETWLGQKTVFMHKKGVPSSEENSPGLWSMARFLPHWELCAVPNLHNCTRWPRTGCHLYLLTGDHFPLSLPSLRSYSRFLISVGARLPKFSVGSWIRLSGIPREADIVQDHHEVWCLPENHLPASVQTS